MYFFIDPANLTDQGVDHAYGPLHTDPTNIYNTTSRFQLTEEAKAFACQTGIIFVQQSYEDDKLVNIAIKPIGNLGIPLEVEYYIYRGILKDSLINDAGTCEIQTYDAATSNDLISRIRQDNTVTDFGCAILGYGDGFSDASTLRNIFGTLRLITVAEGEWIGTFATTHTIGFEVVLKSDFNDFDLDYLRASHHEIDVSGLTGFDKRLNREKILRFIDPAAIFGMHHSTEAVRYYFSGATNNTRTTTNNANTARFIYTQLLEHFTQEIQPI